MSQWTVAHQPPLSMEFSRQEYWSGLPFPTPGDLPNPAIKPTPSALAGRFFTIAPPEKSVYRCNYLWNGLSLDFSFFCKMHPPPPSEAGVRIGAWSHIHMTWLPTTTADWIQSRLIQLVSRSSRIRAQLELLVQLKLQRQTFESCEMPHPGMNTWEEATG